MANECDVITLFDMEVSCNVINEPTSVSSYDGVLSVNVIGGTSPYTFLWENGSRSQTITNLGEGEYQVTVVDFYGDYTASTVCSLVAPVPSPTPTPTPTPTPVPIILPEKLCLSLISQTQSYSPIEFTLGSTINGRSSWTSDGLTINWNPTLSRWEISGWTLTTGLPVSSSQSLIPLSSWVILGQGSTISLSMIEGECPVSPPMVVNVSSQNTTCSGNQNCDGSILVTVNGGTSPYFYSINNGITFQSTPVFNGLCSGTYTVLVNDSSNNSQTRQVVISSGPQPTSYSVSIVSTSTQNPNPQTQVSNWAINVSPSIPVGTVINFSLVVNTTKYYNGPGGGTINDTILVNKNSLPVSFSSSSQLPTQTYPRPQCSPYTTQLVNETETYNLSMTAGDIINGSFTSLLNITNPVYGDNGCITNLEQSILGTVTNSNVSGCSCCTSNTISLAVGVNRHIIQSATEQVQPPPPSRQILLSNPPGAPSQSEACLISTGLPKYISASFAITNGLIIYNDLTLTQKTYNSNPYGSNYAMLFDPLNNKRYAITFDNNGVVNTVWDC
jgi:hypothetical protein